MNSEEDYGNAFSKHWGNYHGRAEEECVICGLVQTIDYEREKRLDAESQDRAAAYNLSEEGLRHWKRRSLKNDGQIMIYDGGTVRRLESGTVYNGESQVLSEGHQGKKFAPIIIFRAGEQAKAPQ